MFERLRMLTRLPGYFALSWRLFLDPRVPSLSKALTLGAFALILSPLDILDWIPGVGGAGEVALLALVLRAFIMAAPEDVRQEHAAALGIDV